jgi:transcriptional regulator with XRE-family HTH domain
MTTSSSLVNDMNNSLRKFWANLFGDGIRIYRERAGLSIEEAALSAGMESSEWDAIESGCVPDLDLLRPMADAMGVAFDKLATMVALCRGAWEL